MEILDLVLQRLSLTAETEEITRAIAAVGDFIKEYCCLAEIPPSLFPLWADMVYDLLDKEEAGEGRSFAGLSSISMGDVSYGFSAGAMTNKEKMEELLTCYRHRLNKVRRGMFR